MPRNLDHRVEILAPIADGRLQAEIDRVFETLLARQRDLVGAARRRRLAASQAEEGRARARVAGDADAQGAGARRATARVPRAR